MVVWVEVQVACMIVRKTSFEWSINGGTLGRQMYNDLTAWWSAGQAGLGAEPAAYKGPVPGADHAGHGQKCPAGEPWPASPTVEVAGSSLCSCK